MGVYPVLILDAVNQPAQRILDAVNASGWPDLASGCRGDRMTYLNDLVTLLPELILVVLVLTVITADLFLPARDRMAADPAHRVRADPGGDCAAWWRGASTPRSSPASTGSTTSPSS